MAIAEEPVRIPFPGFFLEGLLAVPASAPGIVVFAHGSGSSRHSPRNRRVAERMREAGLGTLLFDLLTEREEQIDAVTGQLRFDIELLSERLIATTDWLHRLPTVAQLPIGYFGSSTGAAAALFGAASRPDRVRAVVSRGGRVDLADAVLEELNIPTLLIVGGADTPLLDISREAIHRMAALHELVILPGATHLFEEPGALDEVAHLAVGWFSRYLTAPDQFASL